MVKCPKILGLITKHTWSEEEWWGIPDPFFIQPFKYIAERKCLVCGEVQQYYQGGASAGWEKVASCNTDKSESK